MARTARRIASWAVVLALLVAGMFGWHHVPGSSGIRDEIRWAFAHGATTAQQNRAYGLLIFAREKDPGALLALFGSLLRERDPRAVLWAFNALTGLLAHPPRNPGLGRTFLAWMDQAGDAEKLPYLEYVVDCLDSVYSWKIGECTAEHRRWLVVAYAGPSHFIRHNADECAGFQQPARLRDRLGVLHASDRNWERSIPVTDDADQPPGDWPAVEPGLPDRAELWRLTRDPAREVRWAAGRILAVCRDRRGLPAVYEWLQSNPKAKESANAVLDELFGSDWRQPFESGGAASQPGAGDGGG